jgi:hypothetical protein
MEYQTPHGFFDEFGAIAFLGASRTKIRTESRIGFL